MDGLNSWVFNSTTVSEFVYDAAKIQFTADGASQINPASGEAPYIINSNQIYYTFTQTLNMAQTGTSVSRIQISNDNTQWYFYDTTLATPVWVEATNNEVISEITAQSNTAAELTKSVMKKFSEEVGSGLFYFKLYLFGDVVVSQVDLKYQAFYTTIKKIRDLMTPYGLRARDPNTGQFCEDEDFLSDTNLQGIIPLADAYLNQELQQDFYYHKDVVEFHDGNGKASLNTYYYPITRITQVIMYNQLLQAMRTFLDSELIIHPEWGEIFLPPVYPAFLSDRPSRAMFGNIFVPGKRNVEIMYDYGYSQPPDDIALIATKYVGNLVLQSYWAWVTRGIQSRSFDGYSESYMQKPFGDIYEQWQKEINQVVLWRRRRFQRAI